MSHTSTTRIAGALSLCALLVTAGAAMADSRPQCDTIAKDVKASIIKEPSKVLMIVEDALVINESCACEIVKTAIATSHADAAMKKQIVQTALAVAPKMAPVIMECSGSSNDDSKAVAVSRPAPSGKDAKNVLPEPVVPPKDTESDYGSAPLDIRGLYLMQPAFGAATATTTTTTTTTVVVQKPKKPRTPIITPMSPSCPCVMNTWTP